ncbi:hypothetical protein, partial [Psychrobacter sp. I-STPA6b]
IYIDKLFHNQGICCTEKCLKVLSGVESCDEELTGRERQFCMLLKSEDKMSRHIGLKMIDKVDLDYLLNTGYIELTEQAIQMQYQNERQSKNMNSLMATQALTAHSQGSDLELVDIEYTEANILLKEGDDAVSAPSSVDDIDPILQLAAGNI